MLLVFAAAAGSCGGTSRNQLALEPAGSSEAPLDAKIGDVRQRPGWRTCRSSPGANRAGFVHWRAIGRARIQVYRQTVTMATPSAARSAEGEYRRRAALRRSVTMDSLRRRRSS